MRIFVAPDNFEKCDHLRYIARYVIKNATKNGSGK